MREHLYKAIRVDNGNWTNGSLLTTDSYHGDDCNVAYILPKVLDCLENFNEKSVEVEIETICQFIQEVNKHRIFESDIVKAYMHGDLETQPFIYPIEYRNGTYWFGNWTWLEFLNVMRFVEVVGNVKDLKR